MKYTVCSIKKHATRLTVLLKNTRLHEHILHLLNKLCTTWKCICLSKKVKNTWTSTLMGLEKTITLHNAKYFMGRYIATLTR